MSDKRGGYTIFWDAGMNFSSLSDENLQAAIDDANQELHKIHTERFPHHVDIAEQGDLVRALEAEQERRKNPEDRL